MLKLGKLQIPPQFILPIYPNEPIICDIFEKVFITGPLSIQPTNHTSKGKQAIVQLGEDSIVTPA
jgi:hypothetical protein